MADEHPRIEWLDTDSIDCLELMRSIIQEELEVCAAAGDVLPRNATSLETAAELAADALLRPFVIRRRGPDQPLMRWIDDDESSD